MARTSLTVQALSGPYPVSPFALDALVWTAADIGNLNDFLYTGREIILVRNDDVGAVVVTLTSIASSKNRTQDVTLSVAAGAYAMFQASALEGWLQSGGKFHLSAPDADLFFAIIRYK